MAKSIKFLSSFHKTHTKMLGLVACACNLSFRKVYMRIPGFHWPISLLGKLCTVRDAVSKIEVDSAFSGVSAEDMRTNSSGYPLASTCILTQGHMSTHRKVPHYCCLGNIGVNESH